VFGLIANNTFPGYTGEKNSAIRFRRNIEDIQRVIERSLLLARFLLLKLSINFLKIDDKRVHRDGEA